jgi:hypothetical protein
MEHRIARAGEDLSAQVAIYHVIVNDKNGGH